MDGGSWEGTAHSAFRCFLHQEGNKEGASYSRLLLLKRLTNGTTPRTSLSAHQSKVPRQAQPWASSEALGNCIGLSQRRAGLGAAGLLPSILPCVLVGGCFPRALPQPQSDERWRRPSVACFTGDLRQSAMHCLDMSLCTCNAPRNARDKGDICVLSIAGFNAHLSFAALHTHFPSRPAPESLLFTLACRASDSDLLSPGRLPPSDPGMRRHPFQFPRDSQLRNPHTLRTAHRIDVSPGVADQTDLAQQPTCRQTSKDRDTDDGRERKGGDTARPSP